jgi:hypothetical protein
MFCEGTYVVEGDLLEVLAKWQRSPRPATPKGAVISDPPQHPTSLPPSRSGIADIPVCTGRNYTEGYNVGAGKKEKFEN